MYPKYTELYKAESRYCHDIGPLNFNLGYKIYDENNFKKIISKSLDFLNSLEPFIKNNSVIVIGDVHGSIPQLFMPLIVSGFITDISYDYILDKFNFTINYQYINNHNITIVYLGDMMYRGIHSHVMAMIEALINICETTDKVKWCFGNHDIHFLRGLYLPKYVLNEYINSSPRYFQIINRMSKFALNNKSIHNYILSDDICNIIFSHTIQSIEGLSKAVDIYNSLIKDDIIKDTKMILENINGDVLNQMARKVLKVYVKTELDKTMIDRIHAFFEKLYWLRPSSDSYETPYIYLNESTHFIGHTPVEKIGNEKFKNKDLVMCDLNTYNNEVFDNPNMFIINLELQKINYFNQVLEYESLDVSNVIKLTNELNNICDNY